MQRFTLLGIILLTCSFAPCIAKPVVQDPIDEVPFSFEKGFVIVKTKIKRDVPVEVVLSTGAPYSIADKELLKLEKYRMPRNYAGGAPPILSTDIYGPIRDFVSVPDVNVGNVKIANLFMGVGSTSELSKAVGREIFGILGTDFFKGRVVQVDFKNRIVRFVDRSSADLSKDNKTGAAGARIILPIIETDPLKLNLPMPVVVSVTVNGKSTEILLDTGTATVLALSSSVAKRLGFTIPAEKSSPRLDRIDSLQLGTYELKGVPVVISAKGTNIDQRLSQYGGVAGSLFLQNFIVTFDFRGKLAILEHV